MEYVYRALNDYDRELIAYHEGICNKKAIEECAYNVYRISILAQQYDNEFVRNLTNQQYDEIYQSKKTECVAAAGSQIIDDVMRKQNYIEDVLNAILNSDGTNLVENEYIIFNILSTLQGHLCPGEKNTEWISLSKSLFAIKKYYLKQTKHAVAVVRSNINQVYDFSNSRKSIAYDLSSRAAIQANQFLINKVKYGWDGIPYYEFTDKKCRNFNYSVSSKEVVYYNQVPQERIVTILSPLETDLALNNILNLPLYESAFAYAKMAYQKLLVQLKRYLQSIGEYDSRTEYLMQEHFVAQNPIYTLSSNIMEQEKLKEMKHKILSYVPKCNNPIQSGRMPFYIDMMERKV